MIESIVLDGAEHGTKFVALVNDVPVALPPESFLTLAQLIHGYIKNDDHWASNDPDGTSRMSVNFSRLKFLFERAGFELEIENRRPGLHRLVNCRKISVNLNNMMVIPDHRVKQLFIREDDANE